VASQPDIFTLPDKVGIACIMPLSYLPPISHYQVMLKYKNIIFDIHENYHKQFYFNRCSIYGANGILKLSIPIKRNGEKTPLKDKEISYGGNWRTIHWRSLQAAYRRSPFFEFYEDALLPVYTEYQPGNLVDWNLRLFEIINKLLDIEIKFSFSESYQKAYENATDFRQLNSPKAELDLGIKKIQYQQVFQERFGFIANLSIIDLLFCEGYRAKELLIGQRASE
jgi:WbqC-like protein family